MHKLDDWIIKNIVSPSRKISLMYVKMRAPVRIGETKKKPQQIDTFTIKHWLTMS